MICYKCVFLGKSKFVNYLNTPIFLDSSFVDTSLFIFFNQLHHPVLDTPMYVISQEWFSVPLYIGLLVNWWLKKGKKQFFVLFFGAVICVGLSDFTTSGIMKPHFKRLRPSHEPTLKSQIHLVKDLKGNTYKGGKYGFASSHASNTFALLMWIILCMRGVWVNNYKIFIGLWALWAITISYTRIYLGVHYPLDILVGALVGSIWACVVFWIFQKNKILEKYNL